MNIYKLLLDNGKIEDENNQNNKIAKQIKIFHILAQNNIQFTVKFYEK